MIQKGENGSIAQLILMQEMELHPFDVRDDIVRDLTHKDSSVRMLLLQLLAKFAIVDPFVVGMLQRSIEFR
jgi:hypothetical protein